MRSKIPALLVKKRNVIISALLVEKEKRYDFRAFGKKREALCLLKWGFHNDYVSNLIFTCRKHRELHVSWTGNKIVHVRNTGTYMSSGEK